MMTEEKVKSLEKAIHTIHNAGLPLKSDKGIIMIEEIKHRGREMRKLKKKLDYLEGALDHLYFTLESNRVKHA